MPKPKALCLERIGASAKTPRFLGCVAVPGREPGLRLNAQGETAWRNDESVACELWVSSDDRLILYRPQGAGLVILSRRGRSLDVPCEKPVVTLDQDEITAGGKRWRIHLHGDSSVVAAPSVIKPPAGNFRRLTRVSALAAVLGATLGCGPSPPPKDLEVREMPPTPPAEPLPPEMMVTQTGTVSDPEPELVSYRVKRGDSLPSIIRSHGNVDTEEAILSRNGLRNAADFRPGKVVRVLRRPGVKQ